MNRRRLLGFAGLTAAAMVLAACTGTTAPTSDGDSLPTGNGISEELIAAAKAEGTLTLYHGTTEEPTREWVKGFTEEYGINVVQLRDSSNPLYSRWTQEENAGQHIADLVILSDLPNMLEASENKLWMDYTPAEFAKYPDVSKREGAFMPLYSLYQTLTYNTDQMTKEEVAFIQSAGVKGLSDPRFKNRISIGNPHNALQILAFFDVLAEQYGWDWLEAVAANKPRVVDSSNPQVQSLVQGEEALALAIPSSVAAGQWAQGAPLEFQYPDRTTGVTWMMGISAGAPHPAAARLFMEWATSAKANSAFALLGQGEPTYQGAEDARTFLKESWYEAPRKVWDDWGVDKEFLDGGKDFLAQWDKVFGYSG
ncbi:ABC transporter substrate-binding protein [Microbacterium sp. SYP-A9085]|uniref:ABC transporter substrate-binding protein n=1 Tax=Microbacterium sp. SYP-A9085 TaxID=2664454 RepID=UPI0015623766|nr:ABC transporter substrate-binding protein [Microbacterium sp. SYP-A9085]